MWRAGKEFPESGPAQRQLLNDGEIDMLIAFNPSEAATAIANKLLPPTARVFGMANGTIGNTSFVAIPYNAAHKEGAMVVANFLLDPVAQARQQDPTVLGNATVLDLAKLSEAERALFAPKAGVVGLPAPGELGRVAARAARELDDAHHRGVGEALFALTAASRCGSRRR